MGDCRRWRSNGRSGRRLIRAAAAAAKRARQRPPNADVWRRLAVDGERLPSLSRLSRAARRPWRIQWKIHVRAAGPARLFLRDAKGTYAQNLPQFLLSSPALAIYRVASCFGGYMIQKLGLAPQKIAPRASSEFAVAVLGGLSQRHKSLPCKYFYDARGSELFEEITRLPEYYLTRAETAVLEAHAVEMAAGVPEGAVVVAFGSGSSPKPEILLAALPRPRAYVPIDVSEDALCGAKLRLAVYFRL